MTIVGNNSSLSFWDSPANGYPVCTFTFTYMFAEEETEMWATPQQKMKGTSVFRFSAGVKICQAVVQMIEAKH